MEKFGLFDIIEKLSPIKKTVESILPTALNALTTSTKKPVEKKQSRPSTASVLSYIKRHEEMSKRIDRRK